jgi:hypothetical protein
MLANVSIILKSLAHSSVQAAKYAALLLQGVANISKRIANDNKNT